MKFAATAKKHMQAMIPPLVTLESTAGIAPETLEALKGVLKHESAVVPNTTTYLEAAWAANDTATGKDMTSISVTQPLPPDPEPGQVLAVDEDGKPEWVTLSFSELIAPKPISVVAALDALTASGVHVGHIDISQSYHPGELPQINLTMTLHTMPDMASTLISQVHEWAAKKGGHLA
jgi:hypothetical protein